MTRAALVMDARPLGPRGAAVAAHDVVDACAVVPDDVSGPVRRDLDPGAVIEAVFGDHVPRPLGSGVPADADGDARALTGATVIAHRDEVERSVFRDRQIYV
ncbi:MAG TPA: hypothetical protein VE977_03495 [Pyrinomonadaceae bacterium]|nr:hypothetical protein [Pyrinomonadaceae bacterium]